MPKLRKLVATCAAVLLLVAGLPGAAQARDVDNIWSVWWEQVTDRQAAEVPFAILFSLPAMVFTTPFWAPMYLSQQLESEDDS